MKNNKLYIAIGFILFLTSLGCKEVIEDKTYKEEYSTLYSFLENNPDYSHYKMIVDAALINSSNQSMANIYRSFNSHPGGSRYTLFLPNNNALDNYFKGLGTSLDAFLAKPIDCWNLTTHHLINKRYYSKDFPNGEIRDTSLNGAGHVIQYISGSEGVTYLLDETASVLQKDLDQSNGVIHIINKVLTPFSYTSCDWLSGNKDYSIFVESLKITGLYSTLQKTNTKLYPFTMFVEADSIFSKKGIKSVENLIALISPNNKNYNEFDNPLYQFVAFHVISGRRIYLADMVEGKTSYETFASYPLSILLEGGVSESEKYFAGVGINKGKTVFDTIISSNSDTTYIDYVSIYRAQSNKPTLSGVLHFTNHVMEVNSVLSPSLKYFFFTEDLALNNAGYKKEIGVAYVFKEHELNLFKFGGDLQSIQYYRSDNPNVENAWGDDYIYFSGNFIISYTTSKIVSGDYTLSFQMDMNKSYGLIDVFVDGEKIGGTFNLDSQNPTSTTNPYVLFDIGKVHLEGYTTHKVTLQAITPGLIYWDYIRFTPFK